MLSFQDAIALWLWFVLTKKKGRDTSSLLLKDAFAFLPNYYTPLFAALSTVLRLGVRNSFAMQNRQTASLAMLQVADFMLIPLISKYSSSKIQT